LNIYPNKPKENKAMVHVLVQVRFENYEKWRAVFEEASTLRKSYGSQRVRIFRKLEHADEVVILGEYEDMERARRLFQSPEFREATQRGGVIGKPEVWFIEDAGELAA
jgi:heme-degrading monooxygenase HmoA